MDKEILGNEKTSWKQEEEVEEEEVEEEVEEEEEEEVEEEEEEPSWGRNSHKNLLEGNKGSWPKYFETESSALRSLTDFLFPNLELSRFLHIPFIVWDHIHVEIPPTSPEILVWKPQIPETMASKARRNHHSSVTAIR